MDIRKLNNLIHASELAPEEFKETAYWARYRKELIDEVNSMDINDLRSGKHPRFASFGFNEFFPKRSFFNKSKDVAKILWNYLFRGEPYFLNALTPYQLSLRNIQEMAFHHCELQSKITNSKHISTIEASTFGNPTDIFEMGGKKYTMAFLEYYIRYCFVNKHVSFRGVEMIIELGSGSGHQIEVLKKVHPGLTILCFDLPVPLYLCEEYLSNVFGKDNVVSSEETMDWHDLSMVKKGKIHFFGNWKFPLVKSLKFDLFWNAASFGEMEPKVVKNYLNFVLGQAEWIYLLQIREGKSRVERKITFDDYKSWVAGYNLVDENDAYQAHKKLIEESLYFEAIWKKGY